TERNHSERTNPQRDARLAPARGRAGFLTARGGRVGSASPLGPAPPPFFKSSVSGARTVLDLSAVPASFLIPPALPAEPAIADLWLAVAPPVAVALGLLLPQAAATVGLLRSGAGSGQGTPDVTPIY